MTCYMRQDGQGKSSLRGWCLSKDLKWGSESHRHLGPMHPRGRSVSRHEGWGGSGLGMFMGGWGGWWGGSDKAERGRMAVLDSQQHSLNTPCPFAYLPHLCSWSKTHPLYFQKLLLQYMVRSLWMQDQPFANIMRSQEWHLIWQPMLPLNFFCPINC